MIPFIVSAWCESMVLISSGGVQTAQCFDTQYNVFDSSTAAVQFYSIMTSTQKDSAKFFEMRQIEIKQNSEIIYKESPLPEINQAN